MKYIAENSEALIEALAKLAPGSSRTAQRSWLKEGRVLVDGAVMKTGTIMVNQGQTVALGAKPRFIKGDLRIHYEDKHIVVVEKPAGLLSVSTDYETGETVHALLKNYYRPNRVFVVHRLDQDTSGVMLFALSEQARDRLKIVFETHDIERSYTAIVEGHLDMSSGKWESYVYEDPNYVVHSTSDPERGRLAVTYYSVKGITRKYSLIDLKLETGRKNQIRVHCQNAGHPIAGDKKYGAVTNPIRRLCLHAHLLAFKHPITQQLMRFESPSPESFQGVFT